MLQLFVNPICNSSIIFHFTWQKLQLHKGKTTFLHFVIAMEFCLFCNGTNSCLTDHFILFCVLRWKRWLNSGLFSAVKVCDWCLATAILPNIIVVKVMLKSECCVKETWNFHVEYLYKCYTFPDLIFIECFFIVLLNNFYVCLDSII